jgi:hypothetical protein
VPKIQPFSQCLISIRSDSISIPQPPTYHPNEFEFYLQETKIHLGEKVSFQLNRMLTNIYLHRVQCFLMVENQSISRRDFQVELHLSIEFDRIFFFFVFSFILDDDVR